MTSRDSNCNADLEQILDDALDAFDDVDEAEAPHDEVEAAPKLSISSSVASPSRRLPSELNSREEKVSPPSAEETTGRAFEDALRALDELRDFDAQASSTMDADQAEADLKLVEQFVTSLGESLAGLVPPPSNDSSSVPTSASGSKADMPIVERLVESIVGHLLSADVLKEPMRQMRAAYANWLPAQTSLSDDQRKLYERQQQLIEQICDKYDKGASSTEIMHSLSDMQETGEIPEGVMSQLDTDGALETVMEKLSAIDVHK